MAIKPTKQQIMERVRRADGFARAADLTRAALTLQPIMEHARDQRSERLNRFAEKLTEGIKREVARLEEQA